MIPGMSHHDAISFELLTSLEKHKYQAGFGVIISGQNPQSL